MRWLESVKFGLSHFRDSASAVALDDVGGSDYAVHVNVSLLGQHSNVVRATHNANWALPVQ